MKINVGYYRSPDTQNKLELLENGVFYDKKEDVYWTIEELIGHYYNIEIDRLEKEKRDLLNKMVLDKHFERLDSGYDKMDINLLMDKYYSDFNRRLDKKQEDRNYIMKHEHDLDQRKMDILDMEVDELANNSNTSGIDIYKSLNDTLPNIGKKYTPDNDYFNSSDLDNYMDTASKDMNTRLDAKTKADNHKSDMKDKMDADKYMTINKIDYMIEKIKNARDENIKKVKEELAPLYDIIKNDNLQKKSIEEDPYPYISRSKM